MSIYALKLLAAVILIGSVCAFVVRPAFAGLLTSTEYKRAWAAIMLATTAAFLSANGGLFFMLLTAIAVTVCAMAGGHPAAAMGTYLLLLVTMPSIRYALGGVDDMASLIELTHARVLTLALLVVPAIRLLGGTRSKSARSLFWLDVSIVGYQLLRLALIFNHTTTTHLLRLATEIALDLLIPYFVLSRGLQNRGEVRWVLAHLMLGFVFAAAIAVAELATQRLTYSGLQFIYGMRWQLTLELFRGDLLRVQAMTPQPLILAFMLIFALGVWGFLKGSEWRARPVQLVFALLLLALYGTGARGAWIGLFAGIVCLLTLKRTTAGAFQSAVLMLLIVGLGLRLTGADESISNMLSSMFGAASGNSNTIEYRKELLDTSLALISQSPWFGVPDYSLHMQHLVQGEGIIDLVNSYLAVALDTGLAGLTLFLMPFVMAERTHVRGLARLQNNRRNVAGEFEPNFLAMLVAVMLTIFTTSSFGIMPFLLILLVTLPQLWRPTEAGPSGASEGGAMFNRRGAR